MNSLALGLEMNVSRALVSGLRGHEDLLRVDTLLLVREGPKYMVTGLYIKNRMFQ